MFKHIFGLGSPLIIELHSGKKDWKQILDIFVLNHYTEMYLFVWTFFYKTAVHFLLCEHDRASLYLQTDGYIPAKKKATDALCLFSVTLLLNSDYGGNCWEDRSILTGNTIESKVKKKNPPTSYFCALAAFKNGAPMCYPTYLSFDQYR